MRKIGIIGLPHGPVEPQPHRQKLGIFLELIRKREQMLLFKETKEELERRGESKGRDQGLRREQVMSHKPGYYQYHLVHRQRSEEKFLERIREKFGRMFEQVHGMLLVEPPMKFGFEGGGR